MPTRLGIDAYARGHHLGPTLSLRGVDNETYYRLVPEEHFPGGSDYPLQGRTVAVVTLDTERRQSMAFEHTEHAQ